MRTRRRLQALVTVAAFFSQTLLPLLAHAEERPGVDLSARLDAARRCIEALTADGEWHHDRPVSAESVSRGRWCRGPIEGALEGHPLPCEGGAADRITLRIEYDRDDLRVVERAALSLSLSPEGADWTVSFYGSVTPLEPGSPLGAGSYTLATISVARSDGDESGEWLSLTRFPFAVGDRVVVAPDEYLQPEALYERFRTPEALAAGVREQLDSLEASVTDLLDRRALSTCPQADARDRYQCGPTADGRGHAMVDTCARRSLTDDESDSLRARLTAEMAAGRAVIDREAESIERAVNAALSVEACWLLLDL